MYSVIIYMYMCFMYSKGDRRTASSGWRLCLPGHQTSHHGDPSGSRGLWQLPDGQSREGSGWTCLQMMCILCHWTQIPAWGRMTAVWTCLPRMRSLRHWKQISAWGRMITVWTCLPRMCRLCATGDI
jgi:hypothetical protein